jgi:hypothetical protein
MTSGSVVVVVVVVEVVVVVVVVVDWKGSTPTMLVVGRSTPDGRNNVGPGPGIVVGPSAVVGSKSSNGWSLTSDFRSVNPGVACSEAVVSFRPHPRANSTTDAAATIASAETERVPPRRVAMPIFPD